MRLDELKPGQRAVITAIKHDGPRLQRLLEMGLFEGTEIVLIRRAPLGDPIEIKITDFNLSLRRDDASLIEVDAHA